MAGKLAVVLFVSGIVLSSAQDADMFDRWISQSDRQLSAAERQGAPVVQSRSNFQSNLPDTQDPSDLSQIDDQLANNFNQLDRIQSRKTQTFRKVDAQLQLQNVEMITQKAPTARSTTAPLHPPRSTETTMKWRDHFTKQPTTVVHTATESDAAEENTEQEEHIVATTVKASTKRLKMSRAHRTTSTTQTTTAVEETQREEQVRTTGTESVTSTALTKAAVSEETTLSADRLPRTWTLPENETALVEASDPIVKVLETQLEEKQRKLETFPGLRDQRMKSNARRTTSTTTEASTTEATVDEQDESSENENNGNNAKDVIALLTTTGTSTRHRRVAPFKKASWTALQDQQDFSKVSLKQLAQDERIRQALGAVQSSMRDKALAMNKRALSGAQAAHSDVATGVVPDVASEIAESTLPSDQDLTTTSRSTPSKLCGSCTTKHGTVAQKATTEKPTGAASTTAAREKSEKNDTASLEWQRVYALRDDRPAHIFPGMRNESDLHNQTKKVQKVQSGGQAKVQPAVHGVSGNVLSNITKAAAAVNGTGHSVSGTSTAARIPKASDDESTENDNSSDDSEEGDETGTGTSTTVRRRSTTLLTTEGKKKMTVPKAASTAIQSASKAITTASPTTTEESVDESVEPVRDEPVLVSDSKHLVLPPAVPMARVTLRQVLTTPKTLLDVTTTVTDTTSTAVNVASEQFDPTATQSSSTMVVTQAAKGKLMSARMSGLGKKAVTAGATTTTAAATVEGDDNDDTDLSSTQGTSQQLSGVQHSTTIAPRTRKQAMSTAMSTETTQKLDTSTSDTTSDADATVADSVPEEAGPMTTVPSSDALLTTLKAKPKRMVTKVSGAMTKSIGSAVTAGLGTSTLTSTEGSEDESEQKNGTVLSQKLRSEAETVTSAKATTVTTTSTKIASPGNSKSLIMKVTAAAGDTTNTTAGNATETLAPVGGQVSTASEDSSDGEDEVLDSSHSTASSTTAQQKPLSIQGLTAQYPDHEKELL